MKKIITNNIEETIDLAFKLTKLIKEGAFIALFGDLGAGKTTFVKGIAKALNIENYLYVNSPSFVIMKEYKAKKNLYHFDVYRTELESFSSTIDYDKYFYSQHIVVVEWASKIMEILPEEYLKIEIINLDINKRKFLFNCIGNKFQNIINDL